MEFLLMTLRYLVRVHKFISDIRASFDNKL